MERRTKMIRQSHSSSYLGSPKWSHRLLIWFALLYWDRVSLSSIGSLSSLCVNQVGFNFLEIAHLCLWSAGVKDTVSLYFVRLPCEQRARDCPLTKQAVLRTIKVWSYPLLAHLWPGFGLTKKIVWKIFRTLRNLFMADKFSPWPTLCSQPFSSSNMRFLEKFSFPGVHGFTSVVRQSEGHKCLFRISSFLPYWSCHQATVLFFF